MQNKKITIIIIIVVGIIIIIGGYYYASKSNTGGTTGDTTSKNFLPLPFGGKSGGSTSGGNGDIANINNMSNLIASLTTGGSRFFKITNRAISGATYLLDTRLIQKADNTNTTGNNQQSEAAPAIRYIERATGHVYESYLDTGVTSKISNTTILGPEEVLFGNNNSSLIYRYVNDKKDIESFVGSFGSDKGYFLPVNIKTLAISPDNKNFVTLEPYNDGVEVNTRSFDNTNNKQLFKSPLSEWILDWPTENILYFTTKASATVNGFIFKYNVKNNSFTRVIGDIKGLTTLSNKGGNTILYNDSSSGQPKLYVYSTAKKESQPLNLSGLPEKCVWAIDDINIYCAIPNNISGIWPDDWYKGTISTDDHFVKIDTSSMSTRDFGSYEEERLDGSHLFLDTNESMLFFTNKTDNTFWMLNLKS
ncbi:MAG: hypothetical protein NTX85_00605 [Candidatus Nomurabacteria bacterium]|nr:hypothetical protein [Candidatus Nomurabacteria bacterium]